ncbi:MAG: OsmC family protein [Pyrinomonadaceae bacterium]|nr:OsmC family protein [Pyrinomonadaceae bacterium]
MAKRNAKANWQGGLTDGKGKMSLGSGAFEGSFSFNTRMGDEPGTNPEELIGAALAGCYTMALSATLEKEGHKAKEINTDAKVDFGKDDAGFAIKFIDLETRAEVEGLEDEEFQKIAAKVKETCPVSKALAATQINLTASLVK